MKVLNNGYYEVFEPEHPLAKRNGYVREHRKVVFDTGYPLKTSDEVHHINGVKTDNQIGNLAVLSKELHTSITWTGRIRRAWTEKERKAISERMLGNKNWAGNSNLKEAA